MQVEHHDLSHEFPNLAEEIQALKAKHNHFSTLSDEYEQVTREIERLEEEDIPVGDFAIEEMKKKRVKLKDDLYQMIVAFQAGQPTSA
ncbi:MAG: DUF465 domain-containing protein [Rhodocyclales bacterium]|nr:DUF465 domain-containing protein [Rhodocyclales bacterium]